MERRAASASASAYGSESSSSSSSEESQSVSQCQPSNKKTSTSTKPRPKRRAPNNNINPRPISNYQHQHHQNQSSKLPLPLPGPSYYNDYCTPTMFTQQCTTRQLSASPPPVFAYPSYPHPHSYSHSEYEGYTLHPVYEQTHPTSSYHPHHQFGYSDNDLPSPFRNEYVECLVVPSQSQMVPLPGSSSLVSPETIKIHQNPENDSDIPTTFSDEEITITPFNMSYAALTGMDFGFELPSSSPTATTTTTTTTTTAAETSPSSPSETSLIAFPLTPEPECCYPFPSLC